MADRNIETLLSYHCLIGKHLITYCPRFTLISLLNFTILTLFNLNKMLIVMEISYCYAEQNKQIASIAMQSKISLTLKRNHSCLSKQLLLSWQFTCFFPQNRFHLFRCLLFPLDCFPKFLISMNSESLQKKFWLSLNLSKNKWSPSIFLLILFV